MLAQANYCCKPDSGMFLLSGTSTVRVHYIRKKLNLNNFFKGLNFAIKKIALLSLIGFLLNYCANISMSRLLQHREHHISRLQFHIFFQGQN